MASPARFIPPYPPRSDGPVPVWRGLFGERARNSVYGWSQRAFTERHIRRQVLGYTVHIPLAPDAVQQVLQGNAANYAKPDIVKRLLDPMIGRGLLTADGQLWRDQRRIVAGNFAPAAVDALIPAFARAAAEEMATWREGEVRDLAEAATRTTMRIITDTLFGGDPRLKTRAALDHIAHALKAGGETRLTAMLGLPTIAYNRTLRQGLRGQDFLRRTLADLVRSRLPDGGPDDFLGRLIRQLREQYAPAEALNLAVDNAATFYLAGHETTANAVSWTLYLLSRQPDLQEEVAGEAQAALDRDARGSHLPDRLPLLRRVVEEALRLYPPVPRMDRQAIAPDTLNGHAIAPGDIVSLWPWILHRHRALWDDPDRFDPDRFLPERRAAHHRFQYVPFGGGPRVCVGMRFAMAEALTLLATWLARWRLLPPPGAADPRPVGSVTLRPGGGVPLAPTNRF